MSHAESALHAGPALLVASVFRRSVAEPIVALAEAARTVSRDKNYSVRVAAVGDHDEIAVLIEAFNEMLAQIHTRDAALQKAHDELEQRVEERTTELVAANRELEVDHGLAPGQCLDMENDPDLKSLHGDPRFDALVAHAKERAAAAQKKQ
jgi:nitrate/nitrite-specific signal transduction histidine kinase